MAYTRHGHHIPGTSDVDGKYISKARCGGPGLCKDCSKDVQVYRDKENDVSEYSGRV